MRLKEDDKSYRAGGVIKRDYRHDHSEGILYFHRHKSTRKWCKGIKGKKHNYEKKVKQFLGSYQINIEKCSNCGKEKYGGIVFARKNDSSTQD
jgi:hypothetical protein